MTEFEENQKELLKANFKASEKYKTNPDFFIRKRLRLLSTLPYNKETVFRALKDLEDERDAIKYFEKHGVPRPPTWPGMTDKSHLLDLLSRD